MADDCSTCYQPVLNTIEGFLKKNNELTNENKGRLTKLGEISEVAASIEKEKDEGKETSRVHQCKALIKDICNTLLIGPYTALVTRLSDAFSMVNEMENRQKEEQSIKLPKAMQGRVDAVNQYLERAKGQLKEIDDTLRHLTPKINEAKKKQFEVSEEEITDLEMAAADVKRALDACKTYLDGAENEFNLLESDINSEIKSYQMKTAAEITRVGAGFMIAGALVVPTEILQLSLMELAEKIGSSGVAALGAAAVTGAIAFLVWKGGPFPKKTYYHKLLLIFRYHSRLRQELERDRMNLRCKYIHSNFVF
ncbi:uncharacterized protein LOC110046089 isoform X2 [Orbicella faveolata]|uniref:uncharacterized protein LOC110046089 isoform X2 n=1 Tax=Orbicella faveolata TaxID=48498 RepID=UPI0009E4AE18|nr:uncharacterized protein LOC110046089 isoform X2 [Orbicella faveolata]